MNKKTILIIASILGILGVILGALGAHILEASLNADQLESYKTAVRYQMWHTLALLFLFIASDKIKYSGTTAFLWTLGVILFSGSIYLLSMKEVWGIDLSWLGPITPIGGLLMIVGWAVLMMSGFKVK